MSKSTQQRTMARDHATRKSVGALPLGRTWPISLCVGLALGSIVFSGDALAGGPTGGVVVGGSGSITQNGNSTVINQASQKLALNWQSFNLSANESVLFNQPSHSAVALNRILDQNPSQIFGKISSNGQIFLINTHGIIFGATAQMNVGGLLASTLDLTPNDFLSGHYNLNLAGANAGIVNHGLIQAASGGSVSLVAGSVLNDGLIFANYGKINLDGADHATLDFDGNGLINIQITGELKERLDAKEAAVTNKGTLRAEDGTVVLQASATKDLFTNLVNNSGVIDASGINTDGGVVRLVGNGGNTTNSATIDASGARGGSIQVLSDKDVLLTGGTLDASGTHGGGEVLVGGDEHGTNPLVQNAEHTQVASNVTINASATQTGDGGKVVVWSNQGTQYYGNIVTRGGDLAGNGGFVEVSGKDFLEFNGTADRLAPHGLAGTLLLDPTDLTISGTGSSSATCTAGICTSNANTSTLKTSALQAALAGGPVNVDATAGTGGGGGTINWTDGTVAAGGNSLTLTGTSIAFNGTLTGLLDLTYIGANPTGTGSATGTGSITGIGASAFNLSGLKTGTAGGISFSGFTAADAQTITGASGFDSATKISEGMAFAAATSVTGTGSITNLGLTTFNLTGTKAGTAGGTSFSGFTAADAQTITGASGFDSVTKVSEGVAFAAATSVTGTGSITNLGSTTFNLTGTTAGTAGGTSFSGFTAADAQTVTGASGFDSATKTSEGVAFAAATSVTGTGSITNLGSTAFNLTGTTAGTAGGTSFNGFTAADTQTVTGASGFNDQAKSNQGMTFASATSVTGTGAITNVVGSFADDTLSSTASLITYSTGFASVSGSGGGVTGVAGNFDLGTQVSSSSALDYSGFNLVAVSGNGAAAAITGSGLTYMLDSTVANKGSSGSVAWTSFGNISDATGTIDFGTGGSVTGNVTAAALNYGSYGTAVTFDLSDGSGTSGGIGGTWTGVTAVTGSTHSDTISGSGQTYTLNTLADKGSNGTVTWTSFENLSDSTAGNFVFVNSASVSGTVSGGGAGTLDYSALITGISVGLTGPKAGSATGTGGFSGISAIKGSISATTDTVTGLAGSDTFTLSGANAFSSSGIAFSGFDSIIGGGGSDTIGGTGQTYALTNATPDAGISNGVAWSGVKNVSDATGTVNFGTSGSVTGNVIAQALNFGTYGSAVAFNLSGSSNATTGIGGTWTGVTSVTGSGNSDTINDSGQTYTLDNATANAGSSSGVTWTSFENLIDATGTVNFGTNGSVAGNVTAQTLDYSSYLQNLTLNGSTGASTGGGVGGTLSGYDTINANASQNNTLTGAGATYTLDNSVANAGSSGTYSWSGFQNITDATGTVNFGTAGSITGNLTAQTLNYASYGTAVAFNLAGTSSTTSGIGGTWTGVAAVTGSSNSDTIKGSGQTYALDNSVANKGSNGTVSWTSFENINDATGTVNFGTGGSLDGNLTAQTLNYGTYASAVAFNVSGASNATTGIGGTWTGVTAVTGSSNSDTIKGSGKTYTLDNVTANAGSGNGVTWTSFENLNDATGTVNFGSGGSIGGSLTAAALNYGTYSSTVTFDLSDGSGASSGIGGTWTGVTSVTGSSGSDTIVGSNQTYNLTSANAGNNGTVSWTAFEKIADAGTGTIATTGGPTYHLSGSNAGTVTTLLPGGYTGIGNLSDSAAGNFVFATGGSVSGAISAGGAGTLDYSALTTGISVGLTGAKSGSATGTGSFSGISAIKGSTSAATDTVTGLAGSDTFTLIGANAFSSSGIAFSGFDSIIGGGGSDTIGGAGQTYTLTNGTPDAGSSNGVAWSAIKNVSDGTGTVDFGTGGSVTGNVMAQTLNYGTHVAAVAFNLSGTSGATTGIGGTWSSVTTVTGSGGSDTVNGSGQTYTLDNTVPNAGSGNGVTWTSFENINDATGTVNFGTNGSVAGNITAQTLDYSSYYQGLTLNVDTGASSGGGVGGTLSGYDTINANASHTNTISGTGRTYALDNSVANKGSSGTYHWSGFQNITDATGTVNFGTAGSITGNLTAQTLNYGAYSSAVSFNLAGTSSTTSGIGGTWTGVTAVTGSTHNDTISGSSQTYHLTSANAGNNGTVGWTSFENLSDSTAGNFVFSNGASVSGTLAGGGAGTLDYSAYTTAVSVGLGGTATGTGGWTGITTVKGGSASDTISGSSQTYNLTGANAGNNGTLSWTSFENLSDGTAGNFVFANGASVSGTLADGGAGTLDYSAYTTAVNVGLGGTATGTGGWTGITTVKGGSASDTISGSNQTYHLTGANAGNNVTVGWTSFENIADAGTGTLSASNQTWSLTGHNQGTVTDLAGVFSGIGNLIDSGTGHFFMHSGADGDISGNLDAGTNGSLDYAGYTTPVNVNVSGAGTTGVGGATSGIAAVTASSNLGVSGNMSGALAITTTGAGTSATLGTIAVGGDLNIIATGAVSQTGSLTVAGTSTIDVGTNAITLTSAGNDFGGVVSLNGGVTHINDLNALTLGMVNSTALTVTSGDLTLAGAVSGTAVSLTSSGSISEGSSGSITATTLTGSSVGSSTLNSANHIGTLGSFSAAGFALTNAQSLVVTGPLNGGANTALTTTAGDLTINGAISGAATTLTAAGAISEGAGGSVTATTLTGQSTGATTLNGSNHLGALGSFSAAGFALTNAQALTVTGALNGGASTALTTTTGDLAINAAVSGTTTSLNAAGAISESGGGSITATTLSGQSGGATALKGANHIGTLGGFTAAGFALTNAQTLSVTGPVNGGGSAALTTTAGDLAINGAVNGTTTTLTSAGNITEGAGANITATTLSGSSVGNTTLNQANHIGTLGSFNTANFALTNAQALSANGPLTTGGAGDISLTTTGGVLSVNTGLAGGNVSLDSAGNLALANNVSGTRVSLASGGAISQSGGIVMAGTLTGHSSGSTTLNRGNKITTLGGFSAAGFSLINAQALTMSGPVAGGSTSSLTTTSGAMVINGALSGTTTLLNSAGAISEGASGSITATTLSGQSAGATSLNGANHVGTLGSFTASGFGLTNAQTLAVTGPINGGASTDLTTTAGDLAINGAVNGTTTTLKSAGAISEGGSGSIAATTLTGQSAGATTLNGANHIGTLGSFSAASFALTNAQALVVNGPVNGGASTALTTTAGDLAINGAVSGTKTKLTSAGAINEGSGGVITAGTLSGSAAGATTLGSASSRNNNMVDILGNFSSLAGFSMTNNKTLTLASVDGSAFTVNAGTSKTYLSVTNGDLFQVGTTPLYNSTGSWGSTGRMGKGSAAIYVIGTGVQLIANVGLPPAYFYAVDSSNNLLPLAGGFAINVPTATGAGSAQNGNHGDSYIDPSVITANYRSYGIVPSGVRLPADQQSACDPDQPDQQDCQQGDAVGMVRLMMNGRR